jgi:glycosyltransferase involved in cell wall biosynthesis
MTINVIESTKSCSVSVIIPTTCRTLRAHLLQRAIESVVTQSLTTVEAILVINGNQSDNQIVSQLEGDVRLRVIKLNVGNVSYARYAGLCAATGDFFCFLDDDDELLPDSLITRVSLFRQNRGADVVVTNGYTHSAGRDHPLVPSGFESEIRSNIGLSILNHNWFASAAPLFDMKSVDRALFNLSFKYYEWTYLFFLLLTSGYTFVYDDALTYRINEASPMSASKSYDYILAYPSFLLDLKKLPLCQDIRQRVKQKYATALNSQSILESESGLQTRAWVSHIKCLLSGGWKYIPYTRTLLYQVLSKK